MKKEKDIKLEKKNINYDLKNPILDVNFAGIRKACGD